MTKEINKLSFRNRVGAAAIIVSSLLIPSACSSGERPKVAEKPTSTTSSTTTTTKPESRRPYYEKYGWTEDYSRTMPAQTVIGDIKGGKKLLVAAGRCTATIYDYGDHNAWEIIQNPAIVQGEQNGHGFTSFVGILFRKYVDVGDGIYRDASVVSIVDGKDVYWGSIGLVPNQLTLVDTEVTIRPSTGEPYSDSLTAKYFEKAYPEPISIYETVSDAEGFKPARIIMVPEDESWRVKEYCNVPGLVLADPPESNT